MQELAAALLDAGLTERLVDGLAERIAGILGSAASAPEGLLTRDELAMRLRVSPVTIDRQVRDGMPREYIGDLPRFDYQACRAWLRERERTAPSRRVSAVVKTDEGPVRRLSRRKAG